MDHELFAPCTLGLESALLGEVSGIGARTPAEVRGGVVFHGDRRIAYEANLRLRCAIRVLDLVDRGEAHDEKALYGLIRRTDWSRFLRVDQTLAVDASVRDTTIRHSGYAALLVKDAIVDQFRDRFGKRPNVDPENPDVQLKVVIKRGSASVYRDTSGVSLHKRGWRPIQVKSPLNEATAAGLLRLSEWDRASNLVDPMCGSGTILIEAAQLASEQAPGLGRRFAFERWIDHDEALWREIVQAARQRIKTALPFVIEGADRHPGALALARRSAKAAGVEALVGFHQADAREYKPTATPKIVFVNPPWGERLGGEDAELLESWRALGNFLHRECAGATAFVLSGNPEVTRYLGLRASRRFPVMCGPIECRLMRYEIR